MRESRSPLDDDPEDDSAEEIFLEYFARREAGDDVAFDDLCENHPDIASRLREIYATWVEIGGLLDHVNLTSDSSGETTEECSIGPLDVSKIEHPTTGDSILPMQLLRRLGRRTDARERYRQPKEIARGGMGAIYQVWDEDLSRPLAMKFAMDSRSRRVRSFSRLDSRTLARFLMEARVSARLDHPGIVRAFDSNLDGDGPATEAPWIALELVADPRWITDLTLNTRSTSDDATPPTAAVRPAPSSSRTDRSPSTRRN